MAKTIIQYQKEVKELQAKLAEYEGTSPKEREVAEARATEVRKAVAGLTVASVVKEVTDVSLSTGELFAQLTGQLTAKTKQLSEIDEAIAVKTKDLETLHGKDIVGSSLAALIEDHDRQHAALKETINEARAEWAEEQLAYNKKLQERDVETAQARTREEDAYTYAREQKRRAEDTAWKNQLEDAKRAETLRAQEVARNHADRENALKLRETEYNAAKARFDGIEAEIATAVKKAEAIVANTLTRDAKHAAELVQRDHQAAITAMQAKLAATESENTRLLAQVTDLGTKLAEAYNKSTDLSVKALEAASGRQALSEIRDFQASTTGNGSNRPGKS